MDHLGGDFTKEHFIVIGDLKVNALALWEVSVEVAGLLAESVFFTHVEDDFVLVVHGLEGLLHEALLFLLVEEEKLGWGNAVQEVFDLQKVFVLNEIILGDVS